MVSYREAAGRILPFKMAFDVSGKVISRYVNV